MVWLQKKMLPKRLCVFVVLCAGIFCCRGQEYDFAAEITRQCLVPDPVGLLDCVENKVTLPYLTSWVDCTNSLGQNVKTSADIINYRCKSVWEGKGVIPEVFYIKDCVIEKTGLPAKNVSAEVLGAYKECESSPNPQQQSIKTAPVQQQLRASTVEYKPPTQQAQSAVFQPPPQFVPAQAPVQQAPISRQPQQQTGQQVRPFQQPVQLQIPTQQGQPPLALSPQQQASMSRQPQQQAFQQVRPFQQPVQVQIPTQQVQPPLPQQQAPFQQFQAPLSFQSQRLTPMAPAVQPIQQQISFSSPQQTPARTYVPVQQTPTRPIMQAPIASGPQYPSPITRTQYQMAGMPQYQTQQIPATQRQPQSQQFFMIYSQAPLPNQQQNINRAVLSQKTVPNSAFVSQQQVSASVQQSSFVNPNSPYSYSFQINHPLRPAL